MLQPGGAMKFADKNIWITGASSGIGKEVAIEISKAQTNLILSGRNLAALKETASLCRENGSRTKIVPFDLADPESISHAAGEVLSEKIKVDALYHFGGISQRSLAKDSPIEVDRKIFEINFFGTVALTKAILPRMIENGGGHIAVTSSIVGKFGFPCRSAYAASKHALHGFFESLRAECLRENIRVSVIIPGRIKTNISLNAINEKGKLHGKMDEGQANGKCAKKAAITICKQLKREKKEILTGGTEMVMLHIRRFLPSLYYYLAPKLKPL